LGDTTHLALPRDNQPVLKRLKAYTRLWDRWIRHFPADCVTWAAAKSPASTQPTSSV